MAFESIVKPEDLARVNAKVKAKGLVDREHLLEFLAYIPTSDAGAISTEVKEWLTALHLDPAYDKVRFPDGHIAAVLTDLDSYGRVKTEHILKMMEPS